MSTPIRPTPGVIDYPVVISPELNLPIPSGYYFLPNKPIKEKIHLFSDKGEV